MIMIEKIHNILKNEIQKYQGPVIELIAIRSDDPYKILVSTILSSRTKDEVTLAASERLFSKANNISQLSKLTKKQIEKLIYPVGFYKNKAKYLKQLPISLKKFSNRIPDNIPDLIELPGVGRKVANLVVSVAFQKEGICVDIHVHRILNRIGYVRTKTPNQTEIELRERLPKKYWSSINKVLVVFGQNICRPISPYCSRCPIRKYCRRKNVKKSR